MNRRKQAGILLWGLLCCPLLAGCAGAPALMSGTGIGIGTPVLEETAAPDTEPAETEPEAICVYVCGCVEQPGVYLLDPEARVADAVAAAGGFSGGADTEGRNLAQRVTDGEQVRIPSLSELQQEVPEWQAPASRPVNLNTAGAEELMSLSGIGEVRAAAIIDYREKNGPFTSIEEITQVSGIGEAALEKIRDRITV